MKLFSLIGVALLATPVNADDLRPFIATNSIGDPVVAAPAVTTPAPAAATVTETVTTKPKVKEHFIGLGVERSAHLAAFPFKHPVKAFEKGTYPIRHPMAAFKKFGELAEPYQPALNAASSLSGPATTVGVFVRK